MRVIVVGSGIVGASCAYTASCRGAEVLLADAAQPGQATAAGAGIVCPWPSSLADDPVWYDFACASARYYPGLVAELADRGEPDLGYRQVGGLILAAFALREIETKANVGGRGLAMTGAVTSLAGILWNVTIGLLLILKHVQG